MNPLSFQTKKIELVEQLLNQLKQKNWQIAVAESCTGGMLASAITSIAGSSDVFGYGVVVYSNDAKIKLIGVKPQSLKKYGAVSEMVAKEMALGIQKISGAEIAISTTGIAGPTGNKNKPIGLVYLGFVIGDKVFIKKLELSGSRIEIQNQTIIEALNFLINNI